MRPVVRHGRSVGVHHHHHAVLVVLGAAAGAPAAPVAAVLVAEAGNEAREHHNKPLRGPLVLNKRAPVKESSAAGRRGRGHISGGGIARCG